MPLDPMPAWVATRRRQIGDRIRTARRQIGLSQMQLAELVGRDHKTVHRWETAATPPDLNDLLLLADALQVELADLVR